MPNKCTRCGKIHSDDSPYLFQGCDKCGSKFFFYVRQEALEKADKEFKELKPKEIEEIERDIRDIIPKNIDRDETVVLDLEAIRVIKPGKYRIDVSNLFTQRPIVIRVGPGRYELDLTTLMSKLRDKFSTENTKEKKASRGR
jgi:predicted  nucleic acid-binding Zn-ribbon protein